jgi:hypothetical protein
MRKQWNHTPPESAQPCPEDNTTAYVAGQVAVWRADRARLIHAESAMEIAAWWHGPRSPGFTAFSHTGTITEDLLPEITFERRTATGSDGDDLDALAAYVRACSLPGQSVRLVYALAAQGTWHVHRAGCADVARSVRRLDYQQDPIEFEAGSEREAREYVVDPETEELGYSPDDDVQVFPCALVAFRQVSPS